MPREYILFGGLTTMVVRDDVRTVDLFATNPDPNLASRSEPNTYTFDTVEQAYSERPELWGEMYKLIFGGKVITVDTN